MQWRRTDVTLEGTAAIAGALASVLATGDVMALTGELGAGKTTLARHVIAARASAAGMRAPEVPSPSFTLVQVYDFPDAEVWHFDLYRLTRAEEAFELGLEEALANGITLIEWPERLGTMLPARRIDVAIDFASGEHTRSISVSAEDSAFPRLGAALANV
jgi:tRNA threonylcarbamoyladenosine biosynthesis protein TsaE